MNTLNQNELIDIVGGFDGPQLPVTADPLLWQQVQDFFSAQQDAAYQAWLRSLTGGLAD